jgi:hypothetical protein
VARRERPPVVLPMNYRRSEDGKRKLASQEATSVPVETS